MKILIAIQARSTSTRLPGKAHLSIQGKPMLQHVIDSCKNAASFLARQKKLQVDVCLLVPHGDDILRTFSGVDILEGDEANVLSRYVTAASVFNPDYIVRVTGDCWSIASHAISRAIKTMVSPPNGRSFGYVTNTDVMPLFRREVSEGYDTEVLSMQMLDWIDYHAEDPFDREHVTTLIGKSIAKRTMPLQWAFIGNHVAPNSIDTKEQYFELLRVLDDQKKKIQSIINLGGFYVI